MVTHISVKIDMVPVLTFPTFYSTFVSSMQALYLGNNGMKSLPSKLFKTCLQLSTLDLHNTEITIDLLRQVCTFIFLHSLSTTNNYFIISFQQKIYHSYVNSIEHVRPEKETVK